MAMRGIGAFIGLVLVLSALPAPAAEFVVVAGGAPGLMPGQVRCDARNPGRRQRHAGFRKRQDPDPEGTAFRSRGHRRRRWR